MMTDDVPIYTRTMAKIYEDQGHLEKAEEIYRHLAAQSPEQKELTDALTAIQRKLLKARTREGADVVRLFADWIDAMQGLGRIQRLRQRMHRLQRHQSPM